MLPELMRGVKCVSTDSQLRRGGCATKNIAQHPKLAQPGWSCSNSIKFLEHSSPSAPIGMLREVFLMSRPPPPQPVRPVGPCISEETSVGVACPLVGAVYDRARFL